MKLEGRVIWITGASSGIGEALAVECARGGARLILSSRNADELARVQRRCAPAAVELLPLDLIELDKAAERAEAALAAFGRVDVLVNNGGISQRSLARETSVEVDERLIRVNYLGQVALTKALLPHFLERGEGHFVVVSSVAGLMYTPMRSGYCGSKYALHGFFDALRAEVAGDGVAVTMVAPAAVKTQISYNALTGDGTPQGSMDVLQQEGISAEACARKIVGAIERRPRELLVGNILKYGVYVHRLAPGLFARLIRRVRVT